MLSNNTYMLNFELKVNLIYLKFIFTHILIHDEATASLLRALTSFNVKRRSRLLEQVTSPTLPTSCNVKGRSFLLEQVP